MSAKAVRPVYTQEEARSLELELENVIKHLKERRNVSNESVFMHQATDALIYRYETIIAKTRTARGLDKPDPRRKAKEGVLS